MPWNLQRPNAAPPAAIPRPPEPLNPVLLAVQAAARFDPLLIGIVTLERKGREFTRREGAFLFMMLSIISAVCMIPFGNYAPAVFGFAFMITSNDTDLPRRAFDSILSIVKGGIDFFGGISGAVQTVWDAFVSLCKSVGDAAEALWPHAKLEIFS
jgi:hypothetical protein